MKITFNHTVLSVEISNLSFGQTEIKRKAELNYLQYMPREKRVIISFDIIPYAKNKDDTYGERLDAATTPFAKVETILTALPTFLIDVTTANYLCDAIDEYRDIKGVPTLNEVLKGKDYAEEFDYYDHIANTTAVVINDLIAFRIQKMFAPN
jgi:hypothetical protein